MQRSAAACVVLTVALAACSADVSPGVLGRRAARQAPGVSGAERVTDGLVPSVGSAWNTSRAAVFATTDAFVEYDLGADTPLVAAALLADNNDTYELSASADGATFVPVWLAAPAPGAGMQWRSTPSLSASARFVRLRGVAGDASLSVAELSLFSAPPPVLPPVLREVSALDANTSFRSAVLVATALLLLLLLCSSARAPWWWNLGLGAAALGGGWRAVGVWAESAPVGMAEVSLVRGVVAVVALAVVLRSAFGPKAAPPLAWLEVGALAGCAALGLAAFFNLGQPQFFDAQRGRPSSVHYYDLRVYYPVAKYFPELKYDGLYLASVAAWADGNGGLDDPQLAGAELRDLRDHTMRPVRDVRDQVEAVKRRFSPERWTAFVADMRYFWESMGTPMYLRSMSDHGGNATPVWLTVAALLFGPTTASEATLLATAALDPLLLLLFAFACWRVFGARTALISLVVFGANDFAMFGSNWAGATLRNDWMVCVGLGVVALAAGRHRWAGAALAFGALIRAFPALALAALALPLAYAYLDARRAGGRWPSPWPFLREQRWFVDTALGAAAFTVGALVLSSLVLGVDAWPLWAAKVSNFTATPHVNHVSLATLVGSPEYTQPLLLAERRPLTLLMIAAFAGLAVWGARTRPAFAAPLLGLCLIPVLANPANYYLHCVFLLPLLAPERRDGADDALEGRVRASVWGWCLALCAAQYLTVRETPWELHFTNASALLLAALAAVLWALLPRDADGRLVGPLGFWMMAGPVGAASALAESPAAAQTPTSTSAAGEPSPNAVTPSSAAEPSAVAAPGNASEGASPAAAPSDAAHGSSPAAAPLSTTPDAPASTDVPGPGPASGRGHD